jgi:hypothetical protein
MANKVLKNIIINWGDFFMKHWWGPCSTFLNFHHVYDPDFDINSSSDVYWGNNNKWKYVNVAHRNYFFFPWPLRRYAWTDGDIGRKNADGSPYAELKEIHIVGEENSGLKLLNKFEKFKLEDLKINFSKPINDITGIKEIVFEIKGNQVRID